MARKAVVDAVEARLAANWTTTPIFGLNTVEGQTPEDGSAYIFVQYPVGNAEQASFGAPGANFWRDTGAFRIVIAAQRGAGKDIALQYVDSLAAIFRGQVFSGVQCFAPSPPVFDDRNEDGNYYLVSFAVPYEFDLIG